MLRDELITLFFSSMFLSVRTEWMYLLFEKRNQNLRIICSGNIQIQEDYMSATAEN